MVGGLFAPPPHDAVISSPTNPTITSVRALQQRDQRWRARAFVVEGWRAIADALATGARPTLVLVRVGEETLLSSLGELAGVPCRRAAANVFNRLSETVTPQGVLAVFPFPASVPPDPATTLPLVLVLDRLRDPGNLGTLLRAAAGAGVTGVYLTPESVDPYNGKVVRAGMGAHFRLPIATLNPDAMRVVERTCPLRVIAEANANVTYDAVDWRQPAMLIIGSEAAGVSPPLAAIATIHAAIPLAAGVESLNAAVAGAVMLFEAARQRRQMPTRQGRE